MRDAFTHANCDCHSHCNGYRHSNCGDFGDAYSNRNGNSNSNSYSHSYGYRNSDFDAYTYFTAQADADATAAADATASPLNRVTPLNAGTREPLASSCQGAYSRLPGRSLGEGWSSAG